MKEKNITKKKTAIIFGAITIAMFSFMFFMRASIDDGAFHLGRLMALASDLSFANLKPWIYSKAFLGTGYALGVFYPDLFFYPFAILCKLGIDAFNCYVLMLIFINFSSVYIFYICIRKILIYENVDDYERKAFVMALMYLIFPYRLWDIYIRVAVGECMFFVFFPIIILGVYELLYKEKFSVMLFIGMTGLAYSHMLSTVIVAVFLIAVYLIKIKKIIKSPKILLYTLINAIFTILCCGAVILPILEMQSFTKLYYATGVKTFGLLKEHTLSIVADDFFSVITTIVFIIVCMILLSRKKRIIYLSLGIGIPVFMSTDLFCWGVLENAMPFLNFLQFPYRILAIASIPMSILLGKWLYEKKVIYVSTVVIIIMSFLYLCVFNYSEIDSIDIYGLHSIGRGEYLPAELREYYLENNLNLPNVKEEYNITVNGDTYSFESQNGKVVFPLTYYKGYAISDGDKVYEYVSENGLIKVEGVEGNRLSVKYVGTKLQKVSLMVSILSFLTIMAGIGIRRKKVRIRAD